MYFLTSTDPEDAGMRKRAPLLYGWGLLMVLVQVFTACAMLLNVIFPSCGTNDHCSPFTTYCQTVPGRRAGRCLPCGEAAPLVPYFSDIPTPHPDRTAVGKPFKL